MSSALVTFTRPSCLRVLDGTNRTHSDYGVVTDPVSGKSYDFHVERTYERTDTPFVKKGTYYHVQLHRNGHPVRESALKGLRSEVTRQFKVRVRAWAAADDAKKEKEMATVVAVSAEVSKQLPVLMIQTRSEDAVSGAPVGEIICVEPITAEIISRISRFNSMRCDASVAAALMNGRRVYTSFRSYALVAS